MIEKGKIKSEIDRLDDSYLELVYKIISQFPQHTKKSRNQVEGKRIASLLKDIADNGGLGFSDPVKWQRKIRQDRKLPCRIQ